MSQTYQAGRSLTDQLSYVVTANTMMRGDEYFYQGRVRRVDRVRTMLAAEVQGAKLYDVVLRADPSASDGAVTLTASCSCPTFASTGKSVCKHIWAVLLFLEESPDLMTGIGITPRCMIDLKTTSAGQAEPQRTRAGDAPEIEVGSDIANWTRQLTGMQRTAPIHLRPTNGTWPIDRQIIYQLDLPDLARSRELVVRFAVRQPVRDGGWSKLQIRGMRRSEISTLPDPDDCRILSLLFGAVMQPYHWQDRESHSRVVLPESVERTLVELMAKTGRCVLVREDERTSEDELLPLTWDSGEPWDLTLRIDSLPSPKEQRYVLGTFLTRAGDHDIAAQDVEAVTQGGLIMHANTARVLRRPIDALWARAMTTRRQLVFTEAHLDQVLQMVFTMPAPPVLQLPDGVHVERTTAVPQPLVRISRTVGSYGYRASARNKLLNAELLFRYGSTLVTARDTRRCIYETEQRRCLDRHEDAELVARRAMVLAGFRAAPVQSDQSDDPYAFTLAPTGLNSAVQHLMQLGWDVEVEGDVYRRPSAFKMRIGGSGIDWFSLEGTADFGGESVELPALLKALANGSRFVKLGDGSTGLLPDEWIDRLGLLRNVTQTDASGQVSMRASQIGLIDTMLERDPEIEFDAQVRRARQRLRSFTRVRPRSAPRGFVGELRPYQRDGLGWLHFLRELGFGGCLADDMGLGKTVQVLALLEQRRQQRVRDKGKTPPSLIVVPRSLLHNWQAEAARFTPRMRVLAFAGADRVSALMESAPSGSKAARKKGKPVSGKVIAGRMDAFDVVLTTYGTLRKDIPILGDVAFDYAILDEAQAIKNAETESAKAVRKLQASHRLAMSGTPIENHIGELHSLFEFLNPGMLGRNLDWVTRPGGRDTSRSLDRGSSNGGDAAAENPMHATLARTIRPFVLRRTKQDVASDLPEKSEQTILCDLGARQRRLYNELRDHYRSALMSRIEKSGIARSKIMVLEALLRLRQAACHCALVDTAYEETPSAKLDVLLPQLSEVTEEGNKALVFSQFTSLLSIVRKRLDEAGIRYAYLDGRTKDRAARVAEFQEDPECRLFLISLKAGGVGLNLTAAGYVFLLDPWWNPAVEAQAIDRAHRIGQTQRVFAYRLIARDTVEERVLELQESKRELADSIIRADAGLLRSLTAEELSKLLS